jgi:hypothetical protein
VGLIQNEKTITQEQHLRSRHGEEVYNKYRLKFTGLSCEQSRCPLPEEDSLIVCIAFLGTASVISWTLKVLRLRMDERPPDMEGSCEYIE